MSTLRESHSFLFAVSFGQYTASSGSLKSPWASCRRPEETADRVRINSYALTDAGSSSSQQMTSYIGDMHAKPVGTERAALSIDLLQGEPYESYGLTSAHLFLPTRKNGNIYAKAQNSICLINVFCLGIATMPHEPR